MKTDWLILAICSAFLGIVSAGGIQLCREQDFKGTCRDYYSNGECVNINDDLRDDEASGRAHDDSICMVYTNDNCVGTQRCVDRAGWRHFPWAVNNDIESIQCWVMNRMCSD